jgi:hypothetical protein
MKGESRATGDLINNFGVVDLNSEFDATTTINAFMTILAASLA